MPKTYPQGLLDTSVLIDIVRARDTIGLPAEVFISSITLAELSYGIAVATDPLEATRRAQRYARVTTWLQPLPFDRPAADAYGELVALVLSAGRSPRPRRFDLLIAAVAVSQSLPLYTLNPADFVGLESALQIVGADAQYPAPTPFTNSSSVLESLSPSDAWNDDLLGKPPQARITLKPESVDGCAKTPEQAEKTDLDLP